jgi:hypothetical protein
MAEFLKAFWAKHTITTHSLAVAVVTLATLYAAVPAFHELVVSIYVTMPPWAHQIVTAAAGIWAFYQGAGKPGAAQ